jgi:hypothetical protein
VIQELAGWDPLKYDEVAGTRLRDGLEAFVQKARDRAIEQFRHEQSLHVAGGLKKAPKLPSILRRGNPE